MGGVTTKRITMVKVSPSQPGPPWGLSFGGGYTLRKSAVYNEPSSGSS